MARQPSRAQDSGISTKRLRRFAFVRSERIRHAIYAVEQEFSRLDDPLVEDACARFEDARTKFESDLADILEYQDQPVAGLLGGDA